MSDTKKCRVRPTVDVNVSIDWSTCVSDRILILFGVAYEAEYWWNQWQVGPSAVGSLITGADSPQGDLMMQGLTIKGAILF